METNQCVGCLLGDDVAALAPSTLKVRSVYARSLGENPGAIDDLPRGRDDARGR